MKIFFCSSVELSSFAKRLIRRLDSEGFSVKEIFIIPEKIETCEFPISCHEGLNDTIVSTNYYYQMKHYIKDEKLHIVYVLLHLYLIIVYLNY